MLHHTRASLHDAEPLRDLSLGHPDRARGGDRDDRGDLRNSAARHDSHESSEHATRAAGGGAARERGSPRRETTCGGCPAAGRRTPERGLQRSAAQAGSGGDGKDQGEVALLSSHGRLELATARTCPDVAAQRAAPQRRAGERRELEPDFSAGRVARIARGDQRSARLEHQRSDLGRVHLQHLGDLGVTERLELRQHQCRALRLRQLAEVGHQLAQLLTALDLLRESLGAPRLDGTLLVRAVPARPQSASRGPLPDPPGAQERRQRLRATV